MTSSKRLRPSAATLEKAFARAESVLAKNWRKILRRKGVTHVDVNLRRRKGKRVDEVVIRVHVEKKLPLDELHPNQVITQIEGIPVDIVESLNTYASTWSAVAGMGIAPVIEGSIGGAGTFGVTCYDLGSEAKRGLTNAHVVWGGKLKSALPTKIPIVLKHSGKSIGMAPKSKSYRNALVDCALIEPADGVEFEVGVPDLAGNFEVGRLTRRDVIRQVRVQKLGAQSGHTIGIVDSITLSLSITGTSFFFQIAIRLPDGGVGFQHGGDSGAVLLKGNQIVGLMHGVTNEGRIGVACHIDHVMSKLPIGFKEPI